MSARFGQNLRALRERAGLTQLGFAKRLGFHSASTVSSWESGRFDPTPATVGKLATALRCSPAELLVGVVSPLDALRGTQELPGPELLLSAEEAKMIRVWRQLAPEDRAYLASVLLPSLAATRHRTKRRAARTTRQRRR